MITYHELLSSKFEKFGLSIPIVDDRSEKIYNNLPKEKVKILNDLKPLTIEQLLLVHDKEFIQKLFGPDLYKELDSCFEFSDYKITNEIDAEGLRDHILLQASCVYESIKLIKQTQFVYHLGGGMHHAHSNQGRGFCLINDIVLAARLLQKNSDIKKVWIIDLDAHKGDGSAQITKNDDTINTLSIHMKNGWPLDDLDKTSPWFISSTVDIPIDINQENGYCNKLSEGLNKLEQISTTDLAIIISGADPYENDSLKSSSLLKLTKKQLLERDVIVYNFLKKRNIPQFYLMAGGYGEKSWEIYYQFLNYLINNNEI